MTSPTAARRRPDGRYDPPSPLVARIFAVVLTLLFLGLLAAVAEYLYDRYTTARVQARVVGFSVLSAEAVRIDLEVLKPAGSPAYCIVRSRGSTGAEVGRAVVVVDAEGTAERTVRIQHELATSARAVTGEAGRCSAEPIPTRRPAP